MRYQLVRQPTGRAVFPGFVARSRQNLEQVLTDPQAWADLWLTARDKLVRDGASWQ